MSKIKVVINGECDVCGIDGGRMVLLYDTIGGWTFQACATCLRKALKLIEEESDE